MNQFGKTQNKAGQSSASRRGIEGCPLTNLKKWGNKEMEEIRAICRSDSPWASLVVLVRKKMEVCDFVLIYISWMLEQLRMHIVYQELNSLLIVWMAPGSFSCRDLKLGYWQVKLDNGSIPMMTFTLGPLGVYKSVRMPFGLTNAPATFQRLMESCLEILHLNWCIIYLDNIIINSMNPKEHLERLQGAFERLTWIEIKTQQMCLLEGLHIWGRVASKTPRVFWETQRTELDGTSTYWHGL